ncbi:hypothetical protein BO71DRAFT_488649 [Aspergillus ellipticus CBS 707.79]|uniref:Uncharacterized protein n=1 Tax=Aspergillus ellipticus CBS 707.79 TaxID=1448320 RepID=A0A319CUY2_9EURO|nr:hypothetical protein BO71DRAFT_488649 [Aspergillus ellipticus CBS 707.79]
MMMAGYFVQDGRGAYPHTYTHRYDIHPRVYAHEVHLPLPLSLPHPHPLSESQQRKYYHYNSRHDLVDNLHIYTSNSPPKHDMHTPTYYHNHNHNHTHTHHHHYHQSQNNHNHNHNHNALPKQHHSRAQPEPQIQTQTQTHQTEEPTLQTEQQKTLHETAKLVRRRQEHALLLDGLRHGAPILRILDVLNIVRGRMDIVGRDREKKVLQAGGSESGSASGFQSGCRSDSGSGIGSGYVVSGRRDMSRSRSGSVHGYWYEHEGGNGYAHKHGDRYGYGYDHGHEHGYARHVKHDLRPPKTEIGGVFVDGVGQSHESMTMESWREKRRTEFDDSFLRRAYKRRRTKEGSES